MTLEHVFTEAHLELLAKNLLLQALPVVFFAIWASMRAEDIEAIAKGELEEKIDPSVEGRLVSVGYGLALAGQVLAYLMGESAAPLPYHLGWCAFVIALVAQAQIKFGMECRVAESAPRKPEKISESQASAQGSMPPKNLLKPPLKTLGSLVAVILVYLFFVQATAAGMGAIGAWFKVSENLVIGLRIGGTLLGVVLAVLSAYAAAPFYLKKILPCKPVEEPEQLAELADCFARAGLRRPDFLMLEVDSFGHHNAMISGFASGRGLFKPSMFITQSLFRKFTPVQRQAVLLHEVSHLQLKHMRNRFLLTFGALVGATLLAGLVIMLTLTFVHGPNAFVPIVVAMFLPSIAPFLCVRRLVETQERQADNHAIFNLGADLEGLTSALSLLDRLNKTDPGQNALKAADLTGHPSTRNRIQALRTEAARRRNSGANLDKAA